MSAAHKIEQEASTLQGQVAKALSGLVFRQPSVCFLGTKEGGERPVVDFLVCGDISDLERSNLSTAIATRLRKELDVDTRVFTDREFNGTPEGVVPLLGTALATVEDGALAAVASAVPNPLTEKAGGEFRSQGDDLFFCAGEDVVWKIGRKSLDECWAPSRVDAEPVQETPVGSVEGSGTVRQGLHTKNCVEYFLSSDSFGFCGVLKFQKSPTGKWWCHLKDEDIAPSVLTKAAVAAGEMPPVGVSWLPPQVEDVIPKQLRYWEAETAEKALILRDQLVSTGVIGPDTVKVADGDLVAFQPVGWMPMAKSEEGEAPFNRFAILKQSWYRENGDLVRERTHIVLSSVSEAKRLTLRSFDSDEGDLHDVNPAWVDVEGEYAPGDSAGGDLINDTKGLKSLVEVVDRGTFLERETDQGFEWQLRGVVTSKQLRIEAEEEGSSRCLVARDDLTVVDDVLFRDDTAKSCYLELKPQEKFSEEVRKISEKSLKVTPSDKERRLVTAIVLEPNNGQKGAPFDPDLQNEVYSAEEIEKSMEKFMLEWRLFDVQHDYKPRQTVKVVENWIERTGFSEGGQDVRKGTWVMTLKILDDALWADVKSGKMNSVSIAGTSVHIPLGS